RYFEVELEAPWELLEKRDPRGYYKRGLAGEFTDIIGYHEPYEASTAEVKIEATEDSTVEELGALVFERLFNHGFLGRRELDVLINGGTFGPGAADADDEVDAEEARQEMIERRIQAERAARRRAAEATPAAKAAPARVAAKTARKAGAASAAKAGGSKAGSAKSKAGG